MMHHNTKLSNKLFGGLENIIWTNMDILTLHCDLDLEHSNPVFSWCTLAYGDVSSDQVWLPRNQQYRRYSRKRHILIMWTLSVTLTLKTANIFFLFWIAYDTLAHDAASPYQVWKPDVLWFRNIIQQTFIDILNHQQDWIQTRNPVARPFTCATVIKASLCVSYLCTHKPYKLWISPESKLLVADKLMLNEVSEGIKLKNKKFHQEWAFEGGERVAISDHTNLWVNHWITITGFWDTHHN